MRTLDRWLGELLTELTWGAADSESGDGVGVVDLALDLPIEARVRAEGLAVSTPRGRLATGFDPPRGRIRVHVGREDE